MQIKRVIFEKIMIGGTKRECDRKRILRADEFEENDQRCMKKIARYIKSFSGKFLFSIT